MKLFSAVLLGAMLLASTFSPVHALPGDTFSSVKAHVTSKGFTFRCLISELSGAPFCTVMGKVGGRKFIYNFSDDSAHVTYEETVRYDAPGFSFLSQQDQRVRSLLAAIYDDAVAQDFSSAKQVAQVPLYQRKAHATFLRGKRFGYVTGRDGSKVVTLFPARDLAQEIAGAKKCATMECGD